MAISEIIRELSEMDELKGYYLYLLFYNIDSKKESQEIGFYSPEEKKIKTVSITNNKALREEDETMSGEIPVPLQLEKIKLFKEEVMDFLNERYSLKVSRLLMILSTEQAIKEPVWTITMMRADNSIYNIKMSAKDGRIISQGEVSLFGKQN
ncbi:MAG TPA: hypothetical protein ENN46_03745 [Candidatus Woesearchaeota archaeon]|nr:hypothetical protein [Candidatus Woesearchaeota archaeon]